MQFFEVLFYKTLGIILSKKNYFFDSQHLAERFFYSSKKMITIHFRIYEEERKPEYF